METATQETRPRKVPGSQLTVARGVMAEIENGTLKEGDHLRERDLAERFGLSRTPVRGALSLLVERGVLEKRDHSGFFVAAPTAAPDLPDDAVQALYDRAALDWFEGRVPAQFTDRDFQNRYEIGRPTAARVLARLAEDGIVLRNPGQGWHFPPTLQTEHARRDSYAYRQIIEPAGILSATFRLDAVEAEALVEAHRHRLAEAEDGDRVGDIDAAVALNTHFHESVAAWSGNQFLHAAVRRQNNLRRLFEYRSLPGSGRVARSLREHLAILDLLMRGDTLGAATTMREHLRAAATSD